MDLSNLSSLQGSSLSPEILASLAAALQNGSNPTDLLNQLLQASALVAPSEVVAEPVAPSQVVVEPVAPSQVVVEPVAPSEVVVEPVAPSQVVVEPVAPEVLPEPVAPEVLPEPVAPEILPKPIAPEVLPVPVVVIPAAPKVEKLTIEQIQNLKKSVGSYQNAREQRLLKLLEFKKLKNEKLSQEAKFNAEWPLAARAKRKVVPPPVRASPFSERAQAAKSRQLTTTKTILSQAKIAQNRNTDRERHMVNKQPHNPVKKLIRPLLLHNPVPPPTKVPVLLAHVPRLKTLGVNKTTYTAPKILRLNSFNKVNPQQRPATAAAAPAPAPKPVPVTIVAAAAKAAAANVPAPVVQAPAPVAHAPAPVAHAPAPVAPAPKPVAQAPAPAPAIQATRPKTAVELLAARKGTVASTVVSDNQKIALSAAEKLAERRAAQASIATAHSLLRKRAETLREQLKKK